MHSSGYERLQSQVIPGYSSLARLSVALLAASPVAQADGVEVMVAGCGTGAELLEAMAQRPDWRLTALDPSAEMLQEARQRLGEQATVQWRQSTVESLVDEAGMAGRFAGALSVLVLQSLPDDGSKLAFLTALARCLQPGAQLVLVDLMQTSLPSLEDQLEHAWQGVPAGQWPGCLEPGGLASHRFGAPHQLGECRWVRGSRPGVPGAGV